MSHTSPHHSKPPVAVPVAGRVDRDSELSARARIIRVAEQLFAEQGIEATSLRVIGQQAGQKNTNAVQYHFDSREGLVEAIRQRHAERIRARREAMIAELPAEPALKSLAEIVVLPIAECMEYEDGGVHYLQIMSQLISHPKQNVLMNYVDSPDPSMTFVLAKLEPYVRHLKPQDRVLRMLYVAGAIFHTLADFTRLKQSERPEMASLSNEQMVRNLVSMIAAALTAEAA